MSPRVHVKKYNEIYGGNPVIMSDTVEQNLNGLVAVKWPHDFDRLLHFAAWTPEGNEVSIAIPDHESRTQPLMFLPNGSHWVAVAVKSSWAM